MGETSLSGARNDTRGDTSDRGSPRQQLLSQLARGLTARKAKPGPGVARNNPAYDDLVMHSGLDTGAAIVGDN